MPTTKAVKDVLEKLNQLKSERSSWEAEWREIGTYVFPRRSNFEKLKGRATRVGSKVYDGTTIGALNLLANGLVGYLVSPATRWFKLKLPQTELMETKGVRQWLEEVEKILYADFHDSNFYEEIVELFKDGGAFGTASMYVQEDLDRQQPNFSCRHPKEIFIAENRYGRVDTIFRVFEPTVRELAEEFGEDNLSTNSRNVLEKSPYDRIEVAHCVFPRQARDINSKHNKDKKWASFYIETVDQHTLTESGYDTLPYIIWRWGTNSDEVYGRGPGFDALSEVLKLNQIGKTKMKQAQMAVDPPLNVPEHMRGRVKWVPRGLNYYKSKEDLLHVADVKTNYPIALEELKAVQQTVEQFFMTDFFLMLQKAPMKMTATEVMERQAEKAAVLGTVIGRIASEFLDPVIDLVFEMAYKARRLPPPPQILIQTPGVKLEVDYMGPLAQAQKKFHVTQGATQAIQAIIPLAKINQGILDFIDFDELTKEMLEAYGMPQKVIRDKELVAKMREAKQKQIQQQQQQAQLNETIKQYPLDKEAPPDSPMADMSNQLRAAIGGVK